MNVLGAPPYERRLLERPADRPEFDDWVAAMIYRSRPGNGYRVPFWASPARRREVRQQWEQIIRIQAGRVYEIGRR